MKNTLKLSLDQIKTNFQHRKSFTGTVELNNEQEIEVLYETPTEKEYSDQILILCHPHPGHQGSMHHKVITTCTKAALNVGLSVFCFNFSGIGKSTGSYKSFEHELYIYEKISDLIQKSGYLIKIMRNGAVLHYTKH
jgi:alpha/beta superfamily hydrolase